MNEQIPVYSIDGSGIDTFAIHHLDSNQNDPRMGQPHRDTNFILAFQESGSCELMVDFDKIEINGPSLLCILPGQIHYGSWLSAVKIWIVAVDGALLDPLARRVLIASALRHRPVTVEEKEAELLQRSLRLLDEVKLHPLNDFFDVVQHRMLDTCISLFVSIYREQPEDVHGQTLRPSVITRSFLDLLLKDFRIIKSPKSYAAALHISPAYLNEAVKNTTGFSVSYWINQEVVMEAKRLLYYTDYTVKEIAYNLGYADSAYFIRLFRKSVGQSPLRFREKCRQQYIPKR